MNKSCEIVFNRMSDRRPGPIGSVGPKVRRKSDESPPGQALSGPSPVRLLFQMPDRTRARFAGLLGSLIMVAQSLQKVSLRNHFAPFRTLIRFNDWLWFLILSVGPKL